MAAAETQAVTGGLRAIFWPAAKLGLMGLGLAAGIAYFTDYDTAVDVVAGAWDGGVELVQDAMS